MHYAVILSGLITYLSNLTFEYSNLTMRGGVARHILVRLAAITLQFVGYLLLNRAGLTHSYAHLYLVNIVHLLACMILFEESVPIKVFQFFTSWLLTGFIASLCNSVAYALVPGDMRLTVRLILYFAACVVVLSLYPRFWRNRIREMLNLMEPTNPLYALFPFASFVLYICLFNYYVPPDSRFMFALMVFFEAFIVFLYGFLFMHTHAVFDRIQAENRLENTEKQFLLQKRYYEEIDRNVRAQRERLHDMRHHLIAVDSLARSGDCASISQYVERLISNYGRQIMKRYCENTVANAVIGGYVDIAEAKGIAVTTEIDLPGSVRIDDYELCILFGNTIENAIEACERIPADSPLYGNRFISIKSRAEDGRLVMRVENSFFPDSVAADSGFASSKGARGGIGLESVRRVVLMHQGCVNCERHDGVFVLSVLLCDTAPSSAP